MSTPQDDHHYCYSLGVLTQLIIRYFSLTTTGDAIGSILRFLVLSIATAICH